MSPVVELHPAAPGKKRIVWIDQLKGIAFFFVILGHLSLNATLKSWIYSFHMPVFFFATGFTYNIEKLAQTSFRDYVSKLFRRMLVPYIWMELLTMLLRYIGFALIKHKEVPVKTYLLGIFVGNNSLVEAPSNPLYFILLLFLAELLLFFLIHLTGGKRSYLYGICLLLLPFSLLTQGVYLPWHINVVPTAMTMILLGNLMMRFYRKHQADIDGFPAIPTLCVAGGFLLVGMLVWFFNGRFGLHGNRYGADFLCSMISALCSGAGLSLLLMRLPDLRFLSFIGKNTLFYMGVHKPVLLIFESLFPAQKKNPVFILCAALACYFLLIPLTLACEKLAPFVLGKSAELQTPWTRVGEVLAVVGATCVPYLYFLNHFHGGVLRSTALFQLLSAAVYAFAAAAIWFVCKRVLRFPFLPAKPQAAR